MVTFTGCKNSSQTANPLLETWNTPFGVPPFDRIKAEHFKPAIEEGIRQHNAQIDSIVSNTEIPSFANVIEALDRSGQTLTNAYTTFSLLNAAESNAQMQVLDMELSPMVSAHFDNIYLNDRLFNKVKAVYDQRDQITDPQQKRLTELIYDRFMASQMSEAKYNSVSVDVSAGDYGFKVNGKTLLFKGYTAVYSNYNDENKDDEQNDNVGLPVINEGEIFKLIEHKFEQKFTKPPARYTEASLVKLMEEKGIGRPATYVPTVTLLGTRNYIQKEGKFLVPTKLGEDVTDKQAESLFKVLESKFGSKVEFTLVNGGQPVYYFIISVE